MNSSNNSNIFDISIKNTHNSNTQINVNFNIASNHSRTFSSPFCSPPAIIGRKIINNYSSVNTESINKYPILIESTLKKHNFIKHIKSASTSTLNRKPAISFKEKNIKKNNENIGKKSEIQTFFENKIVKEIKPKLKKKKKNKNKKKSLQIQIQTQNNQNKPKNISQNTFQKINHIISENLRKKQEEKKQQNEIKNSEKEKKLARQLSLHQKNSEIRERNHSEKLEKFLSPFPWGFNQQRLMQIFEKTILKSSNSKERKKIPEDSLRREKLGLSFLNNLNPESVRQVLDKQKEKSINELKKCENIKKNENKFKNNENIKFYMEKKRKQQIEEENLKKQMIIETQIKLRLNLEKLKYDASQQRTTLRNTTIKPRNNAFSTHVELNKKEESLNNESELYDFLEKEAQESLGICSSSSKKYQKSKKNKKITTNIEKTNNIQKRFNEISKNFHSKLINFKQNVLSQHQTIQNNENKIILKDNSIKKNQTNFPRENHLKNTIEETSNEKEMLKMINLAATLIQKTWRGFHTRRILNYYVYMMWQEMTPSQNVFQTPIEPIKKRKSHRRSHSLNEIYEPGNLFAENKKDNNLLKDGMNEINKKIQSLNGNKNENFDYYQIGKNEENEEIHIELNSNDSNPIGKLLYNNKNKSSPEKNIIESDLPENKIEKIENEKDIISMTNLLHEEKTKNNISEKNIQISNILSVPSISYEEKHRKTSSDEEKRDKNTELTKLIEQLQELQQNESQDISETVSKLISKLQYKPLTVKKPIMCDEALQTTPKSSLSIDIKYDNNSIKAKKGSQKMLQIDTARIEEEFNSKNDCNESKSLESMKLALIVPDLRRALGSEQLIRENSVSLSQSSPLMKRTELLNSSTKSLENVEFLAENSIFEGNPFREFTSKKFKEFMNKDNMLNLIKMREKALNYRHKTQIELMKKMLENKRVSPRTYKNKSEELETWVNQEKDEIKKTKKDLEKGWESTASTINRTQRDIIFMQKVINKADNKYFSVRQSLTDEDINLITNFKHLQLNSKFESESDKDSADIINKAISPLSLNPSDSIKIVEKFEFNSNNNQKISETPEKINDIPKLPEVKFVYYEDLSAKSDSKEKIIDQITSIVMEQLLEEFKKDNLLAELTHKGKIQLSGTNKSPVFIGGKDVLEHFPPISSPKKDSNNSIKKNKEQINEKSLVLSQQHRVKSEPDEKRNKENHGIQSNIEAIKLYITDLIDVIKKKHKVSFLTKINNPLGLPPIEKLKLLQLNILCDTSISENYENSYMYPAFYRDPILTGEIFTDLEKSLFKKNFLLNKRNIYELQQIHNKVIFDCFNEALDLFRPFGMRGRPSPWKVNSMNLCPKKVTEKNWEIVLEKSKEKVLEWSSNLCGFIHDKEDTQFLEGIALDDECLAQIREDRMARMLAQEVLDCEEEWVDYEDEETEVEVELADIIFDKFITEGVEHMLMLKEIRKEEQYFCGKNSEI